MYGTRRSAGTKGRRAPERLFCVSTARVKRITNSPFGGQLVYHVEQLRDDVAHDVPLVLPTCTDRVTLEAR